MHDLIWRRGVLLGAAVMASFIASAARSASPRMDGEYGLWVEDRRDTLVVHWLTSKPAPGHLDVLVDQARRSFETGSGTAHAVAVPRPRGGQLTIVYGTLDPSVERDTTRLYLQPAPRAAVLPRADSIFILGDTHGEFDRVLQILRSSHLINDDMQWSGGRKQLVLIGDLMDRGEDVVRLLWFVYALERQAAQAGGRVNVMLGNHETMVFTNDLRYLHPKDKAIADAHAVSFQKMFDIRESVLGRWLVTKPAVLRIGDVLFAHGGVSTAMLSYTPQTVDDSLAKFMGEEWFYRFGDTTSVVQMDSAAWQRRSQFFFAENSVFWYRAYVQQDTLGDELQKVLKRFGATLHVVGHTPTTMAHQKYDGQLIASHPRVPALEMVLLARGGKGYNRYRIALNGERTSLPALPGS